MREKTLNSQSVSPDTQEHDSQNAEKKSDEAVRHKRKGSENPTNAVMLVAWGKPMIGRQTAKSPQGATNTERADD